MTYMNSTQRLVNLTPVTVTFGSIGRTYIDRSHHAFGNLADATAYAARCCFSHVEATDVRTGERYYMPAN